jgi:uncharacterized metal-binding protein YceD (DUF177 family)
MNAHTVWIDVVSLKEGVYEYKYLLDDAFFQCFEHSIIQKAQLGASIQLKKTHYGIDTRLYVDGEVVVACDMCAEDFSISLQAKDEVIYRYKENYSEQEREKLEEKEEREVRWISMLDKRIDAGQELYEIAHIELPMRLRPPQKDGICTVCKKNPEEWLNKIGNSENDTEQTDPRWNELKKLKF